MNLYRFNKQNKVRGVSMTIGIGVWAFLVYILAILVWMLVVKRNIADAYVACLCAGAWTFGYRLLRVWLYARKYDVKPVPADQIKPLGQSFHDNWTSLLMLLGIAIPLLITIGPGAEALKAVASFGEAGVGAINIVLWVPIVVCLICFIVGRKNLPKNAGGWVDLLKSCHSSFCTVGGVLLSPIFISCGLAEVKDPKVIFRPLITDYVLPLLGVAVLVAYGILPVIR